MLMAIITVDQGKVKRIDWDENCHWCGGTTDPQCSRNVYDFDGKLQNTYGKSCFVEDSWQNCSPKGPGVPGNSTKYTSELCQLSVSVNYEIKFFLINILISPKNLGLYCMDRNGLCWELLFYGSD